MSKDHESPLVSCLMATKDRPAFARASAARFLRQRHPRKELIVMIDGEDPVEGLETDEAAGIRVMRMSAPGGAVHSIGHKLNEAAELAHGTLLAIWDDDDWYGNDRLERQVAVMSEDVQVSGTSTAYFWELGPDRWWLYRYGGARPWVAGSTMMLPRTQWMRRPFEDVTIGVDYRFLLGLDRIVDLAIPELCVVGLHGRNTISSAGFAPGWRLLGAHPPAAARAVVSAG